MSPLRRRKTPVGYCTALLALIAVSSCGPDAYLTSAEKDLRVYKTWYDSDLRIYHSALFTPRGEGLRVPGYVLGIESVDPKPNLSDLNGVARPHDAGFVVTHAVKYTRDAGGGMTSCVLFTMIDRQRSDTDPGRYVFEPCQPGSVAAANAVAALRRDLIDTLRREDYSHIIMMVMGWNTTQEEALKNFSAIAGNMVDEARTRGTPTFRPLIVGVTWPSLWKLDEWSIVPDAVVRGLSFGSKADDADEIGQAVLPYIIDYILEAREKSGKNSNVVLLGHSFGARALTRSIDQIERAAAFKDTDRMILLQGAFEFERLFTFKGDLRPPFNGTRPRVTMTSSAYDTAVSTAFWGWYAGDEGTFDKACRENGEYWSYPLFKYFPFLGHRALYLSQIGCGVAKSEANAKGPYGLNLCDATYASSDPVRPLSDKGLRYFDASYLINCNEPFSGGGAHSDIYRRETARFLLDELK